MKLAGVKSVENAHDDSVWAATWVPATDDRPALLLTGSLDETVRLWRPDDLTSVSTSTGHSLGVVSVAAHPSGVIAASASLDSFVRVFDVDHNNTIATLEAPPSEVWQMQFDPKIYSAGVSVFLGGNKPSRVDNVRGDISVNFSCDPDISTTLVDLALEEILCLQKEGPTDEDVLTILEIEQRAHENGLQWCIVTLLIPISFSIHLFHIPIHMHFPENYYWLDRILRGYQSRIYFGDVGTSFEVQEEGRAKVRKTLTPLTAQLALRRILHFPCKKQYTVVILMPQRSRFKKLGLLIRSAPNRYSRDAKILAGMAGLTVLVLNLWIYSRSSLKP